MKCPSCSNRNIHFIGEICSYPYTIGIYPGDILNDAGLYGCNECHLCFRWPCPPKSKLDRLYKDRTTADWNINVARRKDWLLAKNHLDSLVAPGKILDVGCWDGSFLQSLGSSWRRHGIEINKRAIQVANAKGIQIIAEDIDHLDKLATEYNVITAFDIIEHTYSPEKFTIDLSKLIIHNGLIIISSGNTEALGWKFIKNKYWYCSIPEHLSFINISWIYYIANKLNFGIDYIYEYAHNNNSLINRTLDIFKYAIYLLSPYVYGYIRKSFNKCLKSNLAFPDSIFYHPPIGRNFKDHIIVIFKKK